VKILAYTSPTRGHLYPIVPMMAELSRRGHRTHVRTRSDELDQLTPMGIAGSAIDPRVEDNQLSDWTERSRYRAALSVLGSLAERAGDEAPDLMQAIVEHDPDVLLIDINCWGAATVAEASGRPWAMYSTYFLPLPSRDVPPVGAGLPPLGGPLGVVRDRIANRVVSAVFDRAALPSINRLRLRHGLPAVDRYIDLLRRPSRLLALTAESLEYPRGDWPANVRLVGPGNWAPTSRSPAWVADVHEPLVLVTCSSERQADAAIIDTALDGLPAAGMSVIATTAAHDPSAFSVPTGSWVVRFLPHEAVLERAACVICHGGMGITQKAVAAGVPVVVVPFGRDQFEVARRVEVCGVGARLKPSRLTPDRLVAAVRTAIVRTAGGRRIRRAPAQARHDAAAADEVEVLG
jgi:MGT family glycosyltransferase